MSTVSKPIEIPLSKSKIVLLFAGALLFVAIGLWFLIHPPQVQNPLLGNPVVVFFIGLVAILFFGLIALSMLKKLTDSKPGLIISNKGITDNSSGVAAGLIPWEDITDITITQVMNQKFIMILVKNPEAYLERIKNPIKRNAMKMNYKSYGSPISISANALKTDFNSLHQILLEAMAKNRI